jgi:hypothetical protein
MTVELLIANSQAALANKARWRSTNLAVDVANWPSYIGRRSRFVCLVKPNLGMGDPREPRVGHAVAKRETLPSGTFGFWRRYLSPRI